jgi:hypothetical protein
MSETPGGRPARRRGEDRHADVSIFISIASYRDSELGPTIADCLAKARFPERLRFGVCWQHAEEEVAPGPLADPRCSVIDLDWRDSRGGWWARARTMELWHGEDWLLQLDAHHRFAPDWDVALLEQAAATGSDRPLLTAILPTYSHEEPGDGMAEPQAWQTRVHRFVDGIPRFIPALMPTLEGERPMRARFLCGHFVFAPAAFVEEVPYDPDLYMFGGEPVMTLRAYTHGFDLFHPSKAVIWHEHRQRRDHQRDHTTAAGQHDTRGDLLDARSREKARLFLCEPHGGRYGVGDARSAVDYEAYAGISFRECRIQDYTRRCDEPPNPPAPQNWAQITYERRVRIVGEMAALPTRAATSPFWAVAINDESGAELARQDAAAEEIARVLAEADGTFALERWVESTARPYSWLIWCAEADGTWPEPNRITGAAIEVDRESDLDARPRSVSRYTRQTTNGFDVWPVGRLDAAMATNRSGMLIIELADGEHSLREIAEIVAQVFGLDAPPIDEVRRFAADAAGRGLLAF